MSEAQARAKAPTWALVSVAADAQLAALLDCRHTREGRLPLTMKGAAHGQHEPSKPYLLSEQCTDMQGTYRRKLC